MISRLFITLALISSLSCAAAQEAQPKDSAKPRQKAYTKHFSKVVLTASVVATCLGLHKGHPGLTGCGFGLLTGLGCALFERQCRQDGIVILSWAGEGIIREETIEHILELDKRANGAARVGSWLAYLGYYAAAIADKE